MTKNKIIFAILPVLLGLVLVNMANAQVSEYPQITEQECIKEGEWGWPLAVCCEGLKNVGNSEPVNGVCTSYKNPSFVCTNCGNGICGKGENECNCPEDCKDEAVPDYPQITEQECDLMNPCPEGLGCFTFSSIGLRLKCAQPNPCSYFKCPEGTQCLVQETYPSQVVCSCVGPECPATSEDEQTVYELLTQTVIHTIDQNEQPVSHEISLWKTTLENKGILETAFASVKYSNELIVKESKVFMKTSVGEKPINVMPENAIAVSETPDIKSIKKIELKEETQKPVYSMEGIKRARLFFLFPVSLKIETKVSAETGQVISVKKPWWSFLAW